MRKLLLGLALSLVATAASAQWVEVTSDGRGSILYADPTTKKRTRNFVRIWTLIDYAKPRPLADTVYQSRRGYEQVDCSERTVQTLQSTSFAGKMATGEILSMSDDPGTKSFVEPRSIAERLFDFACK